VSSCRFFDRNFVREDAMILLLENIALRHFLAYFMTIGIFGKGFVALLNNPID